MQISLTVMVLRCTKNHHHHHHHHHQLPKGDVNPHKFRRTHWRGSFENAFLAGESSVEKYLQSVEIRAPPVIHYIILFSLLYVYIYIYTYVCIYIHMYVYIYIYVFFFKLRSQSIHFNGFFLAINHHFEVPPWLWKPPYLCATLLLDYLLPTWSLGFFGILWDSPHVGLRPPGTGDRSSDQLTNVCRWLNTYWLVVSPRLWKIWVRQLGWLETQYFWEK